MLFKRVATLLALVFGSLGIAGCLAGAYGVWLLKLRLEQANIRVFDVLDRSLGAVQNRMSNVQLRVKESKVTATEVTGAVREWGAKKGQERIVAQLQIESRVEKLSGQLQAAELRLDASRESIRDIRQVLELGDGLGDRLNPATVESVQELLVSLQDKLQQAEKAVDSVQKIMTPAAGDSDEARQAKVAELLARIILNLSEVDVRFGVFATRMSDFRTESLLGKTTTSQYIVLGSVVCYGLLAWALAGQAALCSWGWRRCRRGR